ncbi:MULTISPECIES: aldehyde dehydrogenase family protein [Streptomyces]|uniref:aldehyde dehydrogenase family protein n=1 Tax=Streptomyces TaxID=1883 RepID=UPI0004BD8CC7|nr:aldehyde dehydrogenase family protein [Streptomyces griseolus]
MNEPLATTQEVQAVQDVRDRLADLCAELVVAGRSVRPEESFTVSAPGMPTLTWSCADAGPGDADRALDAAWSRYPGWAATPVSERAALVRRWAARIEDDTDRYATVIAVEAGKSLPEARRETLFTVATLRALADTAEDMLTGAGPGARRDRMVTVRQRPLGPVLAITPWNFPLSLAARKTASALLTGCPVILKPSERTPASALLMGRDLVAGGAPEGSVSVLPTTRSADLTGALTDDPRLRKVSFTGSTEVGRAVLRATARNILRVSLELGGNAPFVVCPEHDAEKAASGALAAKLANNGQACTAANRLIVPEDARRVRTLLAERFEELRIGWSLDPAASPVGPVISAEAAARVEALVSDALARGAQVVRARAEPPEYGHYVLPALVLGVEPHWPIARQEVFGPVLPVLTYRDLDEAVRIADGTEYGLAAYVYGTAPAEVARVADGLDTGLVAVNHPSVSHPAAPFGGVKHSGYGRENAAEGLSEYMSATSTIGNLE